MVNILGSIKGIHYGKLILACSQERYQRLSEGNEDNERYKIVCWQQIEFILW